MVGLHRLSSAYPEFLTGIDYCARYFWPCLHLELISLDPTINQQLLTKLLALLFCGCLAPTGTCQTSSRYGLSPMRNNESYLDIPT